MRRRPNLKELQKKKYLLPSNLPGMVDDLLEKGVIHPLEKCITIKERIIQLAKEGRIILELDDVVEENHISSQTRELCTLPFWNLEPIVLFEP